MVKKEYLYGNIGFYLYFHLQEGADEDASLKELENKIEDDLFTQLTPEDIREVIESVTQDMLGTLQVCYLWYINPFNTDWTLPSIVLGQLKSSVGVKG